MKTDKRIVLVLLSAVALSGYGCGGKSNKAAPVVPAGLRIVNAVPNSAVSFNAAGTTDTTVVFNSAAVASGSASDYATLSPQTYTVGVGVSDGSLISSTQSLGLVANTNYSLLAFPRDGAVNTFLLTDNRVAPASGFASLAIANAAGDAGPLDIYLVAPNTPLNGISPVYPNVSSRNFSSTLSIAVGTYDVVVTASGKPADVRASLPATVLQSGEIATLALTSTSGGALVNAVMIQQGGAATLLPSTKARVRVVGAFPANGAANSSVAATINGVALATITAPSVGAYTLVNGGSSAYSISVDGVSVAGLPVANFDNGGDYTILVYGSAASPTVEVIQDNNQPSSSGSANMRLINAAVTGGGITLNDNYLPIDTDVQFGSASNYSPATPSATSLLQLTSPVAAFPTYTANSVNIAASGVYTIFVLGSASTPTVVFEKDR